MDGKEQDIAMIDHPGAAIRRDGVLPIVLVDGEMERRPLAERMAHYHVPGFSVAVIDNGEVAWADGFGVQQAGTDDPVRADTLFAGASISKPVTAFVALRLVEEGRLDLDRNVNDYLRSWQVPDNKFTKERFVTLRDLLSHRAGTTVHGFKEGKARPTLLETLDGLPPATNIPVRVDKVPGGTTRYSGGGTTIVQLVLEDVTGISFDRLARSLVFDPLGMADSSFAYPLPDHLLARTARGHNEDGSVIEGGYCFCPQLAAGGIFTTASDYARFILGCRAAYLGAADAILGQGLARQMMDRNGSSDQGLGWRILGDPPFQRMVHGGSCQGYQCEAMGYLECGKGAVVLTNGVGGLHFYWEIINSIAELHHWPDYPPAPRKAVPMSVEQRHRIAGRYRIISGIDAPFVTYFEEDGELWSEITGIRGGKRRIRMDAEGRLFHDQGPFDTLVEYGPDGRALHLRVLEAGTSEVLRAVRVDPSPSFVSAR